MGRSSISLEGASALQTYASGEPPPAEAEKTQRLALNKAMAA